MNFAAIPVDSAPGTTIRIALRRRLSILLFACITPALAADNWLRLSTPHFELYTDAGEKRGREAILYFEQVRTFFTNISPSKKASTFPVRIVAFRNEKQYRPYSP